MNPYFNEVIDAHLAIEQWLGSGEGDLTALLTRFCSDYSMITLTGHCLDLAALRGFFSTQRAARPGLRITVDSMSLLKEWQGGALIRYREKQDLPDGPGSLRWSTVLFTLDEHQPRWCHLHETGYSSN